MILRIAVFRQIRMGVEDGDGVGFHFFNEASSVMDKQFWVEFCVFHTLEIEKHEIRKSFLDSLSRLRRPTCDMTYLKDLTHIAMKSILGE